MPTTDKFDRVTDSTTGRPVITKLSGSGKAIGAASITIANALNWTTSSKIHFAIYLVTSAGVKDPTTQTDWTGDLAGTTVSNLAITGGVDQSYTTAAYVELTPTSAYAKDFYDGIIAEHNKNGTHSNITATSVATTGAITAGGTLTASAAISGITPNKWQNPYKFRVYLNSAQNTTAGAFAIIKYDAKTFDTGNNVDIVTNKGRFTAPVAGFYQFNAGVNIGASGSTLFTISLYKNGVQISTGNQWNGTAAGNIGAAISDILQLAAGDYVEAEVFNTNNVGITVASAQTYFSGYIISGT